MANTPQIISEKEIFDSFENRFIEANYDNGEVRIHPAPNTAKIEKAIKKLAEKIGEVVEL